MAMEHNDVDLESGKDQAIDTAQNAHRALNSFVPQSVKNKANGMAGKAASKVTSAAKTASTKALDKIVVAASNPGTAGFILLAVFLFIVFGLVCTVSSSMLASTDNTKKKADEFFMDVLKKPYDDAKTTLENNVVSFIQLPMTAEDEYTKKGYNCGGEVTKTWSDDNTLKITTTGEKIVLGSTSYTNLDDEVTWEKYYEEHPDILTDEKRATFKTACTVTVNAQPAFEDMVKIIMGYVSAVNGAFDMIEPSVYEKGVVPEKNEYRYLDEENEKYSYKTVEEYEKKYNKNANRYQSISSEQFQKDFKAFVEKKSYTYKAFDGLRDSDGKPTYVSATDDYSENYASIFFAPAYPYWKFNREYSPLDQPLPTVKTKKTTSTVNEGGEDVYVVTHANGDKVLMYASSINESTLSEGDTVEEFKITNVEFYIDKGDLKVDPGEFDIPILYDMSDYRRKQITNTVNAFTANGDMDETEANDKLDDIIGKYFDSYIQGYRLQDVYARIQPYAGIGGFSPDDRGSGHPFMGSSWLYLTGEEGYPGEVVFTGDHPDWEAIKYHGSSAYDWAQISGNAMVTMQKWMLDLEAADKAGGNTISFRYGSNGQRFWCTEYAQAFFYSIYGGYSWYKSNMITTNACDMASQLVNVTGGGRFQYYSTPVAGTVVSLQNSGAGHVAVIDRVWYEGDELWVSISDGNVHPSGTSYAGVRVQREVAWNTYLSEISPYFSGVVMAGPVKGILD